MQNYLLLILITLSSCIKDYSSTTSSVIKNTTGHLIKIEPFINGNLENNSVIIISQCSEKKVIENAMIRGKATGDCFGRLMQPYDSIIISFDGLKKSTHLKFSSSITDSFNYVLFSNNRSFTNNVNWNKLTLGETKHTLNTLFEYSFSEQDYLNAK